MIVDVQIARHILRPIGIFAVSSVLALSWAAVGFGDQEILSPSSSFPSKCPQGQLRRWVEEKDYRSATALIDQWVKDASSPSSVAFLLVEKAKLLYANQQHTEAQEAFVEAIETLPPIPSPRILDDERQAFDRLFPTYEDSIQSPEACSRLIDESQGLLRAHPDFCSLEHYVAAGLANRGQFIEFFDRFFHAFQSRPDCFLRYKTLGVLHLRLFEASSKESLRESHRQAAVRCLKEAFSVQPRDSTLVVKLAYILPLAEKKALLRSVADELMKLTCPLRRSDCFFLIQQTLDLGELDIAKQIIEKARSWYQYSRALENFSEQLRKHERENRNGESVPSLKITPSENARRGITE